MVRPAKGQIDNLMEEIAKRAERKERVLVTTLTKRMAEDLSSYLEDMGLRVKYLHSEINTLQRVEILRDLRLRKFDCLIGINLLREGLDLPEVSLVAILDADKEGFLRSQVSLIQVAGRCARNVNGEVVMYANYMTQSMQIAINETNRRRKKQLEYNKKHNITPKTIQKRVIDYIQIADDAKEVVREVTGQSDKEYDINQVITELEEEMMKASMNLQFEKAAIIRDEIKKLKFEITQNKQDLKCVNYTK